MKKALYILLLAAESILGLLLMGLVYSNAGVIVFAVIAVIWAALLIPQIKRLKNAADEEGKKAARRRIAWVMLIPVGVGMLLVIYTVVSLFLYFG